MAFGQPPRYADDPQQQGQVSDQDIIDAIKAGQSQGSVQSPIGVPYYMTDPTTGQPVMGPDGQPVRWGATIEAPQGSSGIEGPGTASSYGHIPGTSTQFQLPRYFDGAQWLPASLPPADIRALQLRMVAAGLAKSGELQLGIWDMASVSAYQKLLAFANASGSDVASALNRWQQAHSETPDAGAAARAPLVVKLSNPDDLAAVFRKAVIDQLGQGWSSDKINSMVSAYQQQERETQQQQYAMTGFGSSTEPGPGGEITAPPDPTTFAVDQARQADPGLAQEHDELGVLGNFRQMLGGWQKIQ